jgi:hypothetical protein
LRDCSVATLGERPDWILFVNPCRPERAGTGPGAMENGAAAKNAPKHTLADCRRARLIPRFRSLGLLLKVCDLLRSKTRTETRSLLVPLARLRGVGNDADGAEPPNHGWIEGLCES